MEAWGSGLGLGLGLGLGSESLARTAAGRTSFVEAARPKIRLCAPRGRGQNGEREQLPRCRAGSKHALHPKRPDGARHFDRRRDGGGVARFLERDHRLAAEVAAREKEIGAFRELAAAAHGVLAVSANPAAHSSAAERGGKSRESLSVCSQRSPAPRKRGPTFSDRSTVLVPRPEMRSRPCRW